MKTLLVSWMIQDYVYSFYNRYKARRCKTCLLQTATIQTGGIIWTIFSDSKFNAYYKDFCD